MKLEFIESTDTSQMTEFMRHTRTCGVLTLRLAKHAQPVDFDLVNAFITACGWHPNSTHWRQPTREDARRLLTTALLFDMAYEQPSMDDVDADKSVADFFDFFNQDLETLKFYSNYDWDHKTNKMSSSGLLISGATFNVGVIAATSRTIGILLIEDED